jgi:hypothetical protein
VAIKFKREDAKTCFRCQVNPPQFRLISLEKLPTEGGPRLALSLNVGSPQKKQRGAFPNSGTPPGSGKAKGRDTATMTRAKLLSIVLTRLALRALAENTEENSTRRD